jgi:hypothetical protein
MVPEFFQPRVTAMLLLFRATFGQRKRPRRFFEQIAALTAGLQKLSAQLELIKPAPQTVLNNK